MVDPAVVAEFLAHRRLAVVGASDARDSFGRTIYKELRDRGYDVSAIHPSAETVDGDANYRDLASVPGDLDGVIVMVNSDAAADVVRACIELGISRVWLFKGIGGPGAVSDDAVDLCHEHGISLIEGACPLMFLEPVGWFHRLHRRARWMKGSLSRSA